MHALSSNQVKQKRRQERNNICSVLDINDVFELPMVWPNSRQAEHPYFFKTILRGHKKKKTAHHSSVLKAQIFPQQEEHIHVYK